MRKAATFFLLGFVSALPGAETLTSGDAFVRFDSGTSTWILGTKVVEQRLQLEEGRFRLVSLRNRITGTDFVAAAGSDEFRFIFAGSERDGRTGGYALRDYRISRLPVPRSSPGIEPGLTLLIELEHPQFLLSLHYDVYASTPRTPLGMIRKWCRVTNRTSQTQPLTAISMNHLRIRNELAARLTLHHWQGGGAGRGTNQLVSEPLARQRSRTFSSMAGASAYRVDDVYSGSASYHPYFVLEDVKSGEGIYLGFNYLGPWSVRVWNAGDYRGRTGFLVSSQMELHAEPLAPGASFDTPNSFTGVFKGNLDSAGEQLQDWQATCKWDYTREQYLWITGIYNGYWNDPKHKQRTDLHTREMWRIADLCRRTGARIAHEDDFWFDQRGRGVWEGIEWGELVDYLRQSGVHFKLWMPPQHFAPGTPQDTGHPDWALAPKAPDGITGWYGLGFCVAAQGAHDYMRRFMLDREKRYGTYFYRLDGWVQAPCWAANHDHPAGQPHLQQYRHYLQLLREVKEANPGMGIQGCNSGGEWCNWDKLELVENNQTSDGGGPDDVYYLSYFWSVAKLMEWGAGSNGLPSAPDDPAIERLRRDILMRRYLKQEGVIGRYMRVYHPRAEGAPTPHTYLQVANAERTKAAIFQDAAPKGPAVVYPARLNPDTTYRVSFRFAKETQAATGAELMRKGIRFPPGPANEMALLNLENAPGRGMDRTPPSAPAGLRKKLETWGGRSGVALRWSPSRDNVIVAEYQVLRDGKPADHVAAGEFWFDAGAGLISRYEVVAIDGDGNRSAPGGEKAAKPFKSP